MNIKEREGFIIEPFTASIASAAVAYTFTRDDYVFDAAYDINRNAAFLSAGKRYSNKTAAKVWIRNVSTRCVRGLLQPFACPLHLHYLHSTVQAVQFRDLDCC